MFCTGDNKQLLPANSLQQCSSYIALCNNLDGGVIDILGEAVCLQEMNNYTMLTAYS